MLEPSLPQVATTKMSSDVVRCPLGGKPLPPIGITGIQRKISKIVGGSGKIQERDRVQNVRTSISFDNSMREFSGYASLEHQITQ